MDTADVLRQLDHERRSLPRAGWTLDVLPDITRLRSTDGTHHVVLISSCTSANLDAAIDREIAHHRALGVGFEWTVCSHDTLSDLRDRLAQRGFSIGVQEAVMVFDLAERPEWITAPSDVDVRRVDHVDQLNDFKQTAEAVFGKDYSFTTEQLRDAIAAGLTEHRGYVAYAPTAEPAGVGRLYTHPGSVFGGLYGGGTLPAFRGQGVYRATVAARARDAIAAGMRFLQVDALPTSQPILKRLGFVRIADLWACDWTP